MCNPALAAAIPQMAGGVTQTISGVTAAVAGQQVRKEQDRVSRYNAQLQREQVAQQLGQEAEASGQKQFEAARKAALLRGAVGASPLGDRSVRALGRAIGFELGSDKAVIQRNQEIANQVAAARLRGIEITRYTEKLQIGRHDKFTLAADIIAGIMPGHGSYSNAIGSMSGTKGSTDISAEQASSLDGMSFGTTQEAPTDAIDVSRGITASNWA